MFLTRTTKTRTTETWITETQITETRTTETRTMMIRKRSRGRGREGGRGRERARERERMYQHQGEPRLLSRATCPVVDPKLESRHLFKKNKLYTAGDCLTRLERASSLSLNSLGIDFGLGLHALAPRGLGSGDFEFDEPTDLLKRMSTKMSLQNNS